MFWQKKWGIYIKKESESLDFTGLKIPRDYLSFMEDMNSIYELNSSHYAIVPGNHDISFSDEEFDEKKPVTVAFDKAKASYVNFYRKYFGVEPQETLFSVHRF